MEHKIITQNSPAYALAAIRMALLKKNGTKTIDVLHIEQPPKFNLYDEAREYYTEMANNLDDVYEVKEVEFV